MKALMLAIFIGFFFLLPLVEATTESITLQILAGQSISIGGTNYQVVQFKEKGGTNIFSISATSGSSYTDKVWLRPGGKVGKWYWYNTRNNFEPLNSEPTLVYTDKSSVRLTYNSESPFHAADSGFGYIIITEPLIESKILMAYNNATNGIFNLTGGLTSYDSSEPEAYIAYQDTVGGPYYWVAESGNSYVRTNFMTAYGSKILSASSSQIEIEIPKYQRFSSNRITLSTLSGSDSVKVGDKTVSLLSAGTTSATFKVTDAAGVSKSDSVNEGETKTINSVEIHLFSADTRMAEQGTAGVATITAEDVSFFGKIFNIITEPLKNLKKTVEEGATSGASQETPIVASTPQPATTPSPAPTQTPTITVPSRYGTTVPVTPAKQASCSYGGLGYSIGQAYCKNHETIVICSTDGQWAERSCGAEFECRGTGCMKKLTTAQTPSAAKPAVSEVKPSITESIATAIAPAVAVQVAIVNKVWEGINWIVDKIAPRVACEENAFECQDTNNYKVCVKRNWETHPCPSGKICDLTKSKIWCVAS